MYLASSRDLLNFLWQTAAKQMLQVMEGKAVKLNRTDTIICNAELMLLEEHNLSFTL